MEKKKKKERKKEKKEEFDRERRPHTHMIMNIKCIFVKNYQRNLPEDAN